MPDLVLRALRVAMGVGPSRWATQIVVRVKPLEPRAALKPMDTLRRQSRGQETPRRKGQSICRCASMNWVNDMGPAPVTVSTVFVTRSCSPARTRSSSPARMAANSSL